MATETERILSEVRAMRNEFQDLSLQMRIDTPWVRVRENIRHGIKTIQEVPMFARLCVLGGCVLFTIACTVQMDKETRRKLTMFGIDCFGLALVTVAY